MKDLLVYSYISPLSRDIPATLASRAFPLRDFSMDRLAACCRSWSIRFPTTNGSGHSSVSQMARSSSASRAVICWFARMQAVQATTIRRLMAGTD